MTDRPHTAERGPRPGERHWPSGPRQRSYIDCRPDPPPPPSRAYYHQPPHDSYYFNRPISLRRRPTHDARAREDASRRHLHEPGDEASNGRFADGRYSYSREMDDAEYRRRDPAPRRDYMRRSGDETPRSRPRTPPPRRNLGRVSRSSAEPAPDTDHRQAPAELPSRQSQRPGPSPPQPLSVTVPNSPATSETRTERPESVSGQDTNSPVPENKSVTIEGKAVSPEPPLPQAQVPTMARSHSNSSIDKPAGTQRRSDSTNELEPPLKPKPKRIPTNFVPEEDEEDELIWSSDPPTDDEGSIFQPSDNEADTSQRTNDFDEDVPLGIIMRGLRENGSRDTVLTRSLTRPAAEESDIPSANPDAEPELARESVHPKPQCSTGAPSQAAETPPVCAASSLGSPKEVTTLSREEMMSLPDLSTSPTIQSLYREVQVSEYPPQGGGRRFPSVRGRARGEPEPSECDCVYDPADPKSACGTESCINRTTVMECDKHCSTGRHCLNQRLQRREWKRCSVVDVGAKGYGLRADQRIEDRDLIIEYVGEVIGHAELQRRKQLYLQEGLRHFYFMSLGRNRFIDATKIGSRARFLNHSCNPNCRVVKWNVGAEVRLGVYAWRRIEPGEELTFNYQTEVYGEDTRCLCGESNCCGTLGGANAVAMLGALGISSKPPEEPEEPDPMVEAALSVAQRVAEEAEARAKKEAAILAEIQEERERKRLAAQARREKKKAADAQKQAQMQEEHEKEKERLEQASARAELAAIAARETAQATITAREAELAARTRHEVAQAVQARGQRSRSVQLSLEHPVDQTQDAILEEDVPKLIVAIRQANGSAEVLLLLIERLKMWASPAVQRHFIRLHGLQVLAQILHMWMDNAPLVSGLLTVLADLPLATRNRIDDAGLLALLNKLSQQYAKDRDIRTATSSLKRSWEKLPISYHIGRAKGDSSDPAGSSAPDAMDTDGTDAGQESSSRAVGFLGHRLFDEHEQSTSPALPAAEPHEFDVPPSARTGRWRQLRDAQEENPPLDPRRAAMEEAARSLRMREALASQWISSSSAQAVPDVHSIIDRARRRGQRGPPPASKESPMGVSAHPFQLQGPLMPPYLGMGQPLSPGMGQPLGFGFRAPYPLLHAGVGLVASPQLQTASTPQLQHNEGDSPLSHGSAATPPDPHAGETMRPTSGSKQEVRRFVPKPQEPHPTYHLLSAEQRLPLAERRASMLISEYVVYRFKIELGELKPGTADPQACPEDAFKKHAKGFTQALLPTYIKSQPAWPPPVLISSLDDKALLMVKRYVSRWTKEQVILSLKRGQTRLRSGSAASSDVQEVARPCPSDSPKRKRSSDESTSREGKKLRLSNASASGSTPAQPEVIVLDDVQLSPPAPPDSSSSDILPGPMIHAGPRVPMPPSPPQVATPQRPLKAPISPGQDPGVSPAEPQVPLQAIPLGSESTKSPGLPPAKPPGPPPAKPPGPPPAKPQVSPQANPPGSLSATPPGPPPAKPSPLLGNPPALPCKATSTPLTVPHDSGPATVRAPPALSVPRVVPSPPSTRLVPAAKAPLGTSPVPTTRSTLPTAPRSTLRAVADAVGLKRYGGRSL